MASNPFGAFVTGADVRAAVTAHLRMWTPTYIAEVARQHGWEGAALPPFRAYVTSAADVESWPEDQLPTCVVIVPGTLAEPVRHGTVYRVRWAVGIGVVASGRDRDESHDLATLYGAAVRNACLQQPSLGGFAVGVTWSDERYDELDDAEGSRTIAAGRIIIGVDVDDAVDTAAGPTSPHDPATDPADEWPHVVTVDIETEQEQ